MGTETPGAISSGFGVPPKARPRDENAATDPPPVFSATWTAPIDTVTGIPADSSSRIELASSGGRPTTGTPVGTARPNAPAGSGPSTRIERAPAEAASSTASSDRLPRVTSAARPAIELAPRASKNAPMPRALTARGTDTTPAVTVPFGAPPSGSTPSKSTRSDART